MEHPPPPASGTHLEPGATIARRYRLDRRLARGGMAEVWEATDEVLARPVAVKVLLPHLAADEAFVTRFRQEAISAARLSDPHIVSIYDTCSDDGTEAIVMELVRGSTLRQVLDEHGALQARQAADIAAQVATALHHAHQGGLVHRDVKPGNILLSADGRVLVTDFGIAKAAEASHDLTEVGQVVGTAKYLSPEQVEGTPVDARSDVYALGIVLYEMLCGRPPFAGENATATAVARLTTEPLRPRQIRAGVPRDLEEVVLRAMSRDPGLRHPDAAAMGAAITAADLSRADDDGVDATAAVARDQTALAGGAVSGPGPAAAPGFAQSERSWLVPAVLILVVAATLGLVGSLVGQTEIGRDLFDAVGRAGSSVNPGSSRSATALPVVPAAFDPTGDGWENDDDVGLITDGDPTTSWRTERYNDRDVARLKDGVGMILQGEGPRALKRLDVVSPTQGWSAQVYVGDGTATDLAGWGEPVTNQGDIAGDVRFDLGGAEGSAVLIWITDLGDGSVGPRFSTAIADVTLRG
ncbi:MAG TPA: protein kinase [Acidimicrobiales bacterium]|nr:protein kinase [Acidimicrobiales bacterium]